MALVGRPPGVGSGSFLRFLFVVASDVLGLAIEWTSLAVASRNSMPLPLSGRGFEFDEQLAAIIGPELREFLIQHLAGETLFEGLARSFEFIGGAVLGIGAAAAETQKSEKRNSNGGAGKDSHDGKKEQDRWWIDSDQRSRSHLRQKVTVAMTDLLLLRTGQRIQQSERRPRRCRGGDELIVAVRKAGVVGFLDRAAAGFHVPAAVVLLSV